MKRSKNLWNSRGERCVMKNVDAISYVTVNGKAHIATINLLKGITLYGEKLISRNGSEYRTWDPFRSKLAAAYINGLEFDFFNVKIYYILERRQELL
jgi:Fibrillarin-like rRNA methylase